MRALSVLLSLLVFPVVALADSAAGARVERCYPGAYADFCGRLPPVLTVKVEAAEFTARTGRECPRQLVITAYGQVFCQLPRIDAGVVQHAEGPK